MAAVVAAIAINFIETAIAHMNWLGRSQDCRNWGSEVTPSVGNFSLILLLPKRKQRHGGRLFE